jgi:hypothetical protein
MDFLRCVVWILLIALGCAGVIAVITALLWARMMSKNERIIEREVNRRLQNTKIVTRFNVRTVVVDETSGADEETQMHVSAWDVD